jgi:4-amino-4-deoxy-L-arabinose transferase-like glycosyltransferase
MLLKPAVADAPPTTARPSAGRARGPQTPAEDRSRVRSLLARVRPELVVLLLLAAVLNLWDLDRNGMANDYYAAAVRSMSTSWHDFLYGSFDPAGLQTVDKPPLAFMVEALSVRVFGYSSWAMLVPQALMGVATVGLTYDLVRRPFGRAAGFAAGLVLALTPIAVAISRHNNPDALLMLCCVAALWFLVRGLKEGDGRLRWLVLAGVAVGLGFETKMAAALVILPGMALAWFWVAPRGRMTAVKQLLVGGAAMLAVACAWPLLVTLTPAADRPWVSGTSDNSIWSLIFGYNGLGRLFGQSGGPAGAGGPGGGGGGGQGGLFGGTPGPLRLLNDTLGGQGGWMLGFAVVGGLAVLIASRLRRADARTGWIIAVGGAFAVCAVTFSKASGIFHPYYVAQMAPFTAMLVGAGARELVRPGLNARILAPLAVAAGVATELVVLGKNTTELQWMAPVLIGGGIVTAVALAFVPAGRARIATMAAVLALLLVVPGTWAVQTLGHATSSTFPAGGPASAGTGGMGGPGGGGPGGGRGGFPGGARPQGAGGRTGFPGGPPGGMTRPTGGGPGAGGGMFGDDTSSLTGAVRYTQAHGGGTIGVSSQSGAAQSIIRSGANVAGLGGFSGRESDLTTSWVASAVADGRLRWILSDGSGGGAMGQDGRVGATKVMAAVATACTKVSSSKWNATSAASTTTGTTTGSATLYDCAGKADAITAAAGAAS